MNRAEAEESRRVEEKGGQQRWCPLKGGGYLAVAKNSSEKSAMASFKRVCASSVKTLVERMISPYCDFFVPKN